MDTAKDTMVEDIDIRSWQPPEMGENAALPTAKQLEVLQQQAREEGKQQGYQEGLQQAQAEVDAIKAQMQEKLELLDNPMQLISNEVESEILNLVQALAIEIIGREIAGDQANLLQLIQQAKTLLPSNINKIDVYLNPADIQVLQEVAQGIELHNCQLLPDPNLAAGGCYIKSQTAKVDASIEQQVKNLLVSNDGGQHD